MYMRANILKGSNGKSDTGYPIYNKYSWNIFTSGIFNKLLLKTGFHKIYKNLICMYHHILNSVISSSELLFSLELPSTQQSKTSKNVRNPLLLDPACITVSITRDASCIKIEKREKRRETLPASDSPFFSSSITIVSARSWGLTRRFFFRRDGSIASTLSFHCSYSLSSYAFICFATLRYLARAYNRNKRFCGNWCYYENNCNRVFSYQCYLLFIPTQIEQICLSLTLTMNFTIIGGQFPEAYNSDIFNK